MSLFDAIDKRWEEDRKKKEGRYQVNLAAYNQSLVSRDNEDHQYRKMVIPFQLVVESDPEDFGKGIAEGIKTARDRMAQAISNFMKSQVMQKEQWPIDTFQGADGKLCYGITVYVLTDEEMKTLEAQLSEPQTTA